MSILAIEVDVNLLLTKGPLSATGHRYRKARCALHERPLFLLRRGSQLRPIQLLHLRGSETKHFRIGLDAVIRAKWSDDR